MEQQIDLKSISPLAWVVIGILTLGAGTLIFWSVVMVFFRTIATSVLNAF